MSSAVQIPGLYRHEDMWLSDIFPLEKVFQLQAFELEPTDVVVGSYPKTGTTLLQELVWLIRNNGDVEKANQTKNVARVPFMELRYRDNFTVFANLEHPRHMKTHLPYRYMPVTVREGKAKVVYIVRNPKDCLVSFYHFHRMNEAYGNFGGTWDDFFQYFRDNNHTIMFGNPLDHMLGFWEHKDDKNVHIVFYEHAVKRPKSVITELAKFLECELTDDVVEKIVEATSFDVMKRNPMTNMTFGAGSLLKNEISPFMRKGEVGDWRNYFNDEQNRVIEELEKVKLQGTGLEFVYE